MIFIKARRVNALMSVLFAVFFTASCASRGDLDFKEYEISTTVDLNASQARLFSTKHNLIRTLVSDPGIAEPALVSEYELVLAGKTPGKTTLFLWDDDGGVTGMKLEVKDKDSKLKTLRDYGSLNSDIGLEEIKSDDAAEQDLPLEQKPVSEDKPSSKPQPSDKKIPVHTPKRYDSEKSLELAKQQGLKFDEKNKLSAVSFDKHFLFYETGPFEYPYKKALNICVSRARAFKIKGEFLKVRIDNPELAEPVAVSPNEVVILAKKSGNCKFGFEDQSGSAVEANLNIEKEQNRFGGKTESSIENVSAKPISLEEVTAIKSLAVNASQPQMFKTESKIVKTYVSDPQVVKLSLENPQKLTISGVSPGKSSVFLWDDSGGVDGYTVTVTNEEEKVTVADEEKKDFSSKPESVK